MWRIGYKEVQLSCCFLRRMCSLPGTKVTKTNRNVRVFEQSSASRRRPLVLLFGWLFAQPKNLKKFAELYLHQGFDVISVQVFLAQLLRPKKVQTLMKEVLDLCLLESRKTQPLFVHCLSVGGYMYGEILTNINKNPGKYGEVGSRIRGQIMDSVVDYYGIPGGIARAITHDKTVGGKIESTLEWYLRRFRNVTKDYIKASEAFHDNVLNLPSLFLYSVNDPVCSPDHCERIVAEWRERGIPASSRFWNDAPHVCTFKHHREEYTQVVVDFIRETGI